MEVKYSPGDRFKTRDGFGMVLPDGKAIIISGKGGRSGYSAEKTDIPNDAHPSREIPPHEVTFALDVTAYSHELLPFPQT